MNIKLFLLTLLAGTLSGIMTLSMKGCSSLFGFKAKQILAIMFTIGAILYWIEMYLTGSLPSFKFEKIPLIKALSLLGLCSVLCFLANWILFNQMFSPNINPAIPFILSTGTSTLLLYLISLFLFGIAFSLKQFIALILILSGVVLLK